ncbi:MAG TPA: N-methyl-L-tryptophan oxidase [Phycisphaerales bacterium]|nr:N-methyl-L-tryptophan oxidase [Phycisphaerales bacterium]
MSTPRYDTIVLGLGTFGSAAAAELAQRGKKVLGLERFSIPHMLGSHHGHSRVFRTAYFEHPDYVPLLRTAHKRWIELDRKKGGGVFHQTGALYAGPKGCRTIEGAMLSAKQHRLDVQRLSPRDLEQRYPQIRVPEGFDALWETCAGMIVPEMAVSLMAREAMAKGAELHGHEPVLEWHADRSGVRVTTAKATYEAGSLVIAAGAWSGQFLRELLAKAGLKLKVTRQSLAWYWPRRPALFGMTAFPVWAIENEQGLFHYGFPMQNSPPGLKIALHREGPTLDPDSPDRSARPEDEAETREALRRYFPDADGPLLSLSTCLYTNSPDGHPVVDLHPEHPNVSFITGCSGHGFKFAPVFGEVLADLAMHGKTDHGVGFLGLKRFKKS